MDCSLPASRIRAIARTGEGPLGVLGAAQVRGLLAGKCSGRSEPPRSASLCRNQDLGPWRHGRPGSALVEVLGLWGATGEEPCPLWAPVLPLLGCRGGLGGTWYGSEASVGPVGRWDLRCEAFPVHRWQIEVRGCCIPSGAGQFARALTRVLCLIWGPKSPGKLPECWGGGKSHPEGSVLLSLPCPALCPGQHLSSSAPGPHHSLSPPPPHLCLASQSPGAELLEAQGHGV